MTRAMIFDCDGVLADTERFGHLPAFNAMFAEVGLPVRWSEEEYAQRVKTGGGKERLATLLTPEFVAEHRLPVHPAARRAMLADWHRRKTAHYTALVGAGALPGRPGIARIVAEAATAGWRLAVASTSAEVSVRAVLERAVGVDLAALFAVFAGDIVERKKPAPDVYLLALRELGLRAKDVVIVEDSENGLRAALASGLATVVTVSSYTAGEDFTGAALVVSDLGEPEAPAKVLADPLALGIRGHVRLSDLETLLGRV